MSFCFVFFHFFRFRAAPTTSHSLSGLSHLLGDIQAKRGSAPFSCFEGRHSFWNNFPFLRGSWLDIPPLLIAPHRFQRPSSLLSLSVYLREALFFYRFSWSPLALTWFESSSPFFSPSFSGLFSESWVRTFSSTINEVVMRVRLPSPSRAFYYSSFFFLPFFSLASC